MVVLRDTKTGRALKTHGMRESRFYNIYSVMKGRCVRDPRYVSNRTMCLWKSFEDFKADMYESYLLHCKEFGEENTSIDRIDNLGHYTKGNCRWATHEVQCFNRRSNLNVEFNGEIKPLKKWTEELGLNYKNCWNRLKVLGWPITRVLIK